MQFQNKKQSISVMNDNVEGIIDSRKTMKIMLKEKTEQKTTPGLYVNAFKIEQSDWDNTNDFETLMQDYTDMRNGDAFVSSSVDVLINPIVNSKINIQANGIDEQTAPSEKAEEAKKYIEYCFNNMYNSPSYYQRHLALAIYYGVSFFEEVWLMGDTYEGKTTNRIIKMSPIQADTIKRYYYDENMEFIGLQLYKRKSNAGTTPQDISADRIHRFTPLEEFGNVQGRSILRPIRIAYNVKKKIWNSSARAADRGAGVPVITLDKSIKDTDGKIGSKVQTIIQTIGNSDNCGVVDQDGVFKFRLEGLQNQGDNLPLLNFSNSEIVYNSLTQFIISGIGSNGSRAATSEHKAPFEAALRGWIKMFEENYNKLIEKMIDNSYLFGALDHLEYPTCLFENVTDKNLMEIATNWNTLVNSHGMTPTIEDELNFRSIFGFADLSEEEIKEEKEAKQKLMPDLTSKTENLQTDKPIDKNTIEQQIKEEDKLLSKIELSNYPISEKYKNMVHPGIEYLNDIESKVSETIDAHYKTMIDSASLQVQKGQPVVISQTQRDALYNDLNMFYNKASEEGYKHGSKEIQSIDNSVKLANKAKGQLRTSGNAKKLEYVVKLLGNHIETQINTKMLNSNKQTIEKAGGISQYIEDLFYDSQKQIKSTMLNNTVSGYMEGITDSQAEYEQSSGNKLLKTYTLQLERKNVCDVCFPYEGLIVNEDECNELGLNWEGTPLNPECKGLLGGNQCQCTWRTEGIAGGN